MTDTTTPTTTEPGPWKITVHPRGQNPGNSGQNEGGMIVYLSHVQHGKQEVHRVAFVRANSTDGDAEKKFDDKLDEVMATAHKAATVLNELDAGSTGQLV